MRKVLLWSLPALLACAGAGLRAAADDDKKVNHIDLVIPPAKLIAQPAPVFSQQPMVMDSKNLKLSVPAPKNLGEQFAQGMGRANTVPALAISKTMLQPPNHVKLSAGDDVFKHLNLNAPVNVPKK
jgi:hypothetical protein